MAQVNLNTRIGEDRPYKSKSVVQAKMGEKSKSQQIADGVKVGVKTAIKDAIMPTIQRSIYDLATDALRAGLEAVFGIKMTGGNRRVGGSIVKYGDVYDNRRNTSRPVNSSVEDYKYIEFASKADVEAVLEGMDNILEEYSQVSVADLKDLAGLTAEPVDRKWGWTSLNGARAALSNNCWRLSMPREVRL